MQQEFYTFCSSLLADFIGDRLYPDNLPQNATLPAAVYSITGEEVQHLLSGQPVGVVTTTVQIEIGGPDSAQVDQIARAFALLLDGYRGHMGKEGLDALTWEELTALDWATLAQMNVSTTGIDASCQLVGQDANNFIQPDGSGERVYVRQQDYSIRWEKMTADS